MVKPYDCERCEHLIDVTYRNGETEKVCRFDGDCEILPTKTNKEWLHSASDDELAEFFDKITLSCFICGRKAESGEHERKCIAKENGYCTFCNPEFKEWLNQEHKEVTK